MSLIGAIIHVHVGLKRDPGIPNLYPFKEQLLKQLQERKERAEEEKHRQKEDRWKEQSKRRNLHSLQDDALVRIKEFEKKVLFRIPCNLLHLTISVCVFK